MDALETNIENKKKSVAKAYDSKLKDKVILLDNPKKKSEETKRLTRLKKKQKSITSKEKKELVIYDIPKDCQK